MLMLVSAYFGHHYAHAVLQPSVRILIHPACT